MPIGLASRISTAHRVQEMASFTCTTCGKVHDGLAALTFHAPAPYDWASPQERATDWVLQSDFCRFKDVDFYVRSVLVLPIIGSDQTLEFGVWSTLSKANIDRYWDSFEESDQSKLGPMFSYFANAMPGYPQTTALVCNVIPQDNRQRPLIEFQEVDHPLVHHQLHGISHDEAMAYYHAHMGQH